MTCATCKHARRKPHLEGLLSLEDYSRVHASHNYSQNTLYVCALMRNAGSSDLVKTRKDSCVNYEYDGNKPIIEYCPECDKDTVSEEWFCSECWCDRVDSELFETNGVIHDSACPCGSGKKYQDCCLD